MINERRIRLMTKLAEFEQESKDDLELVKTSFRSDYISSHLLKNLFRITLAFLIGFALWICYHMERVLEMLNVMDVTSFGIRVLVIYGIVVLIFMVVTYIVYSLHFYHHEKQFLKYQNMLQRLVNEYEIEDTQTVRKVRRMRRENGGRHNGSINRI